LIILTSFKKILGYFDQFHPKKRKPLQGNRKVLKPKKSRAHAVSSACAASASSGLSQTLILQNQP
jgi:hypothetical protein